MKCNNVERGCTWVGTVGTLEEHVATCKFTLLPCPKECNKVKQFMRKDLDKHLKKDCPKRDYSCQHCGEKGTYASIQVHDKTCMKKKVICPNDGCSEKIIRQLLTSHIVNRCEHAIISCKYIHTGCEVQLKRKDMAAHELDYEAHFKAALDTINLLRQECQSSDPIKLKFKLTGYRKKREFELKFVRSPSYYTSPNGYHMALDVDVNGCGAGKGTHISVFAKFLKGKYDAQLKWPLIGKVTFMLLNQLEDKNHYQDTMELTAEHNTLVGSTWGWLQFIPHSALDYDVVKNTQYLKDDTLYFRMSVEAADHKPWLQ